MLGVHLNLVFPKVKRTHRGQNLNAGGEPRFDNSARQSFGFFRVRSGR
jgi:hypothetical protein